MMHIEVSIGYLECRCCHNAFNRLDDPHGNIICWDCHTAGCNNSGCKREYYVAWQHQMNATP